MKAIWEDDERQYCPGCGGLLDAWGLCQEALSKIGLDLAGAWRLVSLKKKRMTLTLVKARVAQIVSGQLTSENAGEICLICRRQFFHGVCPGCGLEIQQNSPLEIYLLFLAGRWS